MRIEQNTRQEKVRNEKHNTIQNNETRYKVREYKIKEWNTTHSEEIQDNKGEWIGWRDLNVEQLDKQLIIAILQSRLIWNYREKGP